ncbi:MULTISPECIES: flagellar biosynthesis anti-sigma factor FlgM [Kosakonia]|jgi:negative regulator of flagellin synthesis FlgM|uniref:Negative regulator of flagellin synthesis n=1 Tax=Kosakonia oryzae TaxID=497725 RepID=A0AA94KQQ7_9ENTR|nr:MULTISPECIES: flagellar biosynthesis anti-sigma factor FlgM [Kosakonia]ANI81697.1 flagellar biosynthesis anti-sigma factor FlgM [Kosakonia oryzae]KIS45398.1 flagellar biosynthesis anti-sigma factor FlgM [Kosakonia radicincitans YD4]SFC76285.1 negative regulator of flagellin synthesis FlgM [Kosakonia oryzae]
MNIERTRQAKPVQATSMQSQSEIRDKNAQASQARKDAAGESSTQVKLSQLTQQFKSDTSRDIDTARVAEIKAKMDAGELTLDSDKIASALVRDIFNFS